VQLVDTYTKSLDEGTQRYSKEKNMQITLFKRRDIHTVDLAGKFSIESATLLGEGGGHGFIWSTSWEGIGSKHS
jgi:hypothetical protein